MNILVMLSLYFFSAQSEPSPFEKAQQILTDRCSKCHSEFSEMTEKEWLNSSFIVPRSPTQSLLFRKLRGAKVGGPENMPPSVSRSLTAQEIETIRTWIENISPQLLQGAEQRKALALDVLKKNCATCHQVPVTAKSPQHPGTSIPAFGLFDNENDFVVSGLIMVGDTKDSILLRSLKKFGDLNLMPPQAAINEDEFSALQKWVEQMGEP